LEGDDFGASVLKTLEPSGQKKGRKWFLSARKGEILKQGQEEFKRAGGSKGKMVEVRKSKTRLSAEDDSNQNNGGGKASSGLITRRLSRKGRHFYW